jgi:YD repeat-containing protein
VIREEEKILIDSDTPWNKGSIEYDYDNSGNLISIKSKKVASHFYNYDYRGLLLIKKTIMPEDFNNIISIDKYKYSFFK